MSLPDLSLLTAPIEAGGLYLEPLSDQHRERLRAICPEDDAVWEIFPTHMTGADFDRTFDSIIANPGRFPFAIFEADRLTGISGYLNIDAANHVLEIGGTYMTPAVRGTGLNRRVKALLIPRAFDAGFTRIELRIDARNLRSIRAVEKLGAVREGVMRRHIITWTGHVRDSVLFSILKDEWAS